MEITDKIIAAPSWVFPGSIEENALFLTGKVNEIGLLFMETQSSLAYGPDDLPPSLASLPLRWHIHLPADLPMNQPKEAAEICVTLFKKVEHLGLCRSVVHPPAHEPERKMRAAETFADFLNAFADSGLNPAQLMPENTPANDLVYLQDVIADNGLFTCIDTGHMLAFKQNSLVENNFLLARAGMLHLNAPGTGYGGHTHLPLTSLSSADAALIKTLCLGAPLECVFMLELFRWEHIEESLPILRDWLADGDFT